MSIRDLAFRAPSMDDAQRTYALIARCDVHDYGEPDTELEDLIFDWQRIDLARDAWLVATPAGDLVGYGAVIRWRTELKVALYVDPSWAGRGIEQAILARCEARGQAIAQERATDLLARTYVAHTNERNHEIVQAAGFALTKYHFQMGVRLDGPPPAPTWPAGVSVRTAVPDQDGRAIHRLVETAFARPGRTATTFEEWTGLMMRADILDPDLWFLAAAGETLVGVCLSFAYPDMGWVRQLAVAERWRRRGLGTALLRHAFGVFHGRGYQQAGLAVDGENPDAYAFYEQIGMRRVRQHDEYARGIEHHP
jgi:mycothiol synthase